MQSPINPTQLGWMGLGTGLAIVHLILTWQLVKQTDQLVINALFWLAILGTLTRQRCQVGSDRRACFVGFLLLGLILAKSGSMAQVEAWFVRLFPAFASLGLSFVISGFRLNHQWRAGLLLLPLMIPRSLIEQVVEQLIGGFCQVITAQFTAFMLHYLGFQVMQKGTVITLNQGSVEVLFRCTGIPLLILLAQLALLFLITFPLPQLQQIKILLIATAIAFLLSSLRVALMVVVVSNPTAFAYWHGGEGSQIFSTGAIGLFGWVCQQFLPRIQIDGVVPHSIGNDP